jgi:hypothetical protein
MFKPIIGLFFILWASNTRAASFTPWQERQVLAALDTYCATAWCEGNFNLKFKALHCQIKSHSCRLQYNLINRATKTLFHHSCEYSPVNSYKALLDNAGGDNALNDLFLETLDDCFEKAESRSQSKLKQ